MMNSRLSSFSSLFQILLCLVAVPTSTADRGLGETTAINWDESFDAFVPYPPEALAALPNEQNEDLPPVFLDMIVNIGQQQPLFDLAKGIVARNYRVIALHHFHLQGGWIYNHTTGVTSQCRTSTAAEEVKWDNCTRHCTNHGRYCLNSNENHKDDEDGAWMVKESARRMCFDVVYEPGSIVLWKYMEDFEEANCHEQANKTDCSYKVMDDMDEVKSADIQRCIDRMGGFGDNVNVGLEQELQSEKNFRVTKDTKLPLLEINQFPYDEKYNTHDMFQAVCDSFFPEPVPYACDFCGECKDVRKCLWHLECDGEPLDVSAIQRSKDSSSSSATISDGSTSNQQQSQNDDGSGGWKKGLVWAAIMGLVMALVFAYKKRRTRAITRELAHAPPSWAFDHSLSLDFKNHGSSSASSENATRRRSPTRNLSPYSDSMGRSTRSLRAADDVDGEDVGELLPVIL